MNCKFCKSKPANYTCPRCNAGYCSLLCYRGPEHLDCAESFYKECVESEISTREPNDRESVKKTYEMLLRMRDGEDEDQEEEYLDSDDDDDLADRLAGVDLNDADEVWKHLSASERSEFEQLCASGKIESLVPKFVPWWDREEVKLVEEMPEVEPDQDSFSERPRVDQSRISSLKSLIGDKSPSPTVKFSLLNIVYAYAFTLKSCDLDNPTVFTKTCITISSTLRDGQNFESAEMAVEAAASAANQNPDISRGAAFCREVKRDVLKLVKGPTRPGHAKNTFLLSALCHLQTILADAVKELKKEKKTKDTKTLSGSKPPWTRQPNSERFDPILDSTQIKLCIKKIDFYLSWVSECYHEYSEFYQ